MCGVLERRVQHVFDLFEDRRRHLVARVVEEVDADRPGALGEAFYLGGLVSVVGRESVSAGVGVGPRGAKGSSLRRVGRDRRDPLLRHELDRAFDLLLHYIISIRAT